MSLNSTVKPYGKPKQCGTSMIPTSDSTSARNSTRNSTRKSRVHIHDSKSQNVNKTRVKDTTTPETEKKAVLTFTPLLLSQSDNTTRALCSDMQYCLFKLLKPALEDFVEQLGLSKTKVKNDIFKLIRLINIAIYDNNKKLPSWWDSTKTDLQTTLKGRDAIVGTNTAEILLRWPIFLSSFASTCYWIERRTTWQEIILFKAHMLTKFHLPSISSAPYTTEEIRQLQRANKLFCILKSYST